METARMTALVELAIRHRLTPVELKERRKSRQTESLRSGPRSKLFRVAAHREVRRNKKLARKITFALRMKAG